MGRLNWIKEVDWKKQLKGDMREMAEIIGIEKFLEIWTIFLRTSVYFSEGPVNRMKRKYIQDNFAPGKVKELARKLETSETFIYQTIHGKSKSKVN